jgi:hypothetical protein
LNFGFKLFPAKLGVYLLLNYFFFLEEAIKISLVALLIKGINIQLNFKFPVISKGGIAGETPVQGLLAQ